MEAGSKIVLEHSALGPAEGVPVASASLSDRQRLAVLLQAASLLCHLDLANRRLVDGWEPAHIDGRGMLVGLLGTRGSDEVLPQVRLRRLGRLLFGAEERVAGRGQARRIVRLLLEDWVQELSPLSADEAVKQILDRGVFLWHTPFRSARSTLAGVHRSNGDERLWVAGPEWFRRPLLEQSTSITDLRRRLASESARALWSGGAGEAGLPTHAGRWRASVAAWRARDRVEADDRLEFARALLAVGRFRQALEATARLRRPHAKVLRAQCQYRLGELRSASRTLAALETRRLDDEVLVEAAAVAVRVLANLGDLDGVGRWVETALRVQGCASRARAELVAFGAAWDRGDMEEMQRRLRLARSALEFPRLGWRWHKARGQSALARGRGGEAVDSLARSLAGWRRSLTPLEAGDLWNEMALARAMAGDLRGAERALLHVIYLHREVEGPRKTTLPLFNLAEIRLRRGRLEGVEEILRQSSRENREAGNWRGIVHDTELWARFELVRGRPGAALERLTGVLEEVDRRSVDWRLNHLQAWVGRALGLLGCRERARDALSCVGDDVLAEFEPEERPALWALAGDRDRARAAIVVGDRSETLWSKVLSGVTPSASDWQSLRFADEYRFARLVLDLKTVAAASVPPSVARTAARIYRSHGAGALAERLDEGGGGSWEAVARYFDQGDRGPAESLSLFEECGYGEVRLIRLDRYGDDEVLIDGPGGPVRMSAASAAGELVLKASWDDPVLKVLLHIAARSLERAGPPVEAPPPATGIVGESRLLRQAIERLAQLAPEDVPVFLLGETGTGKELAARYVHQSSKRASGPCIPLNCAAVSEELLMSDLFGHVKGAYTGAVRDRVGVFEAGRGGTVFLDEIGDLPLRAQGFLLRVLQEGEVRRVGESVSRPTDVRVVAATHRDVEEMVRTGDFRADLYYRLRVASIELPPLRERAGDVMLLAEHFLERLRPGAPPRVSRAARSALLAHHWPGNVRELENVLSVAVATAGDVLYPEHLELPAATTRAGRGYHEMVLDFRRSLVREALDGSRGNQAEAARALGLTRQALSYLVKKLDI